MTRLLIGLIALALVGFGLFQLVRETPPEPVLVVTTSPVKPPPAPDLPKPIEDADIKAPAPSTEVTKDNSGPIVVRTPRGFQLDEPARHPKNLGELTLLFPNGFKPLNGFAVVVPAEWAAAENADFNPLLKEYKAPWVVRLWRIRDNQARNDQLIAGNYDVLLYRNDGAGGRSPTLISVFETSTGRSVDIQDKHLEGIDLK